MIFRCYTCKQYRFWNNKCYEVIATDSDGNDLFSRKICQKCGDEVDQVYQSGKTESEVADWKIDDGDE